jgi:hypothetical protein
MPNQKSMILIEGITQDGQIFRPSDWAERSCGSLSTFEGNRVIYSPLLRPITYQGHRCVLADPRLALVYPDLYQDLMRFAQNNGLVVSQQNIQEDDATWN